MIHFHCQKQTQNLQETKGGMDLGRSTRYESSFIEENVDKGGNALPHEIEEGNVEYKLKLVDPPPERIEHLVTQLKWRLAEGHGEAMYEIGVADNGQLVGLSRRDMESSLKTLRQMGERLRADVSIIRERTVCPGRNNSNLNKKNRRRRTAAESSKPSIERSLKNETDFDFFLEMDDGSHVLNRTDDTSSVLEEDDGERVVAEVLVRKCLTDDQHFLEIRVAIIGGADAGKSTLLGVLTHSELDNGRGKSRLNLLRHRHEIESGRTSSISHQIIGFDPRGDLLNYGCSNITTWEQICETASKVITYLDLCGHPKYQKTTISGLTGHSPDYACLIIGANAGGVSEVPREHLGIAVALKVPVFIVITKIDVATPEDLSRTVTSLLNLLKSPGVRRVPMVIQNEDDLVVAVSSMASSSVIPIFLTSSVTGENLNLLVRFMNLLQKPTKHSETSLSDAVEFSVEETYTVPAVGCVVGGMLLSGSLSIHSGRKPIYFLGPDRGRFIPVKITSIHRQRCPVNHILSGQAATCSLNFLTQSDENGDDSQDFVSAYDPTSNEEESSIPPTYFRVRKGQVILPFLPESAKVTSPIPFTLSASPLPASPPTPSPFPGASKSSFVSGSAGVGRPLSSVPSQIQAHSPAVPEDIHENAESVWEFEADLHVLSIGSKNVGLSAGSQGTLYLGSVRQGAKIVKLRDDKGRWASLIWAQGSSSSGSWSGSPKRRSMSPSPTSPLLKPISSNSSYTSPVLSPLQKEIRNQARIRDGSPESLQVPVFSPKAAKKRASVTFSLPPSIEVGIGMPAQVQTTSSSDIAITANATSDTSSALQSLTLGRRRSETNLGGTRASAKEEGQGIKSSQTSPARSSFRRSPTPPVPQQSQPVPVPAAASSPSSSTAVTGSDPLAALEIGDCGLVRFRFAWEPEWVRIGATVLFKGEGKMKCVGKVVSINETSTRDGLGGGGIGALRGGW